LVAAAERHVSAARRAALTALAAERPPVFPLTGNDVLALGVAPGPLVGQLLSQVKEWWAEAGFAADKAACLARLREIAGRL
jgi:hypothetical protein